MCINGDIICLDDVLGGVQNLRSDTSKVRYSTDGLKGARMPYSGEIL